MALFLRSNTAFTNPLPGTPTIPLQPFTSDTFDRANAATLGTSDAVLGGSKVKWIGNPEAFGVSNKIATMQTFTGAYFAGFAMPQADYMCSFKVVSLQPSGAVAFDARRPLAAISPTQDGVRMAISGSSVTLSKRVNVVSTNLGSPHPFTTGATLGLRVKGTKAELLIDGVVVESHAVTDASLQTPGHVGFSGVGIPAGFAFDDFVASPVA